MDSRRLSEWWIAFRTGFMDLEPRTFFLSPWFIGITSVLIVLCIWFRRPVILLWYFVLVLGWLLAHFTILTRVMDGETLAYTVAGTAVLLMIGFVGSWWLSRR
jgi:hypothetical protein